MKTLFILRHAKSSWDDAGLSDFDRPLNDRGVRAAGIMGGVMRERDFRPQIIVCSTALRARRTAELVTQALDFAGEIVYDDRIYEASTHRLVEVAASINDKCASSMLVGHNPGMEGLILYLTGTLVPMATASLAVIDLSAEYWANLSPGCGKLREVIRPRDIMK